MNNIIPVILFVYNRPQLLARILDQLCIQTKEVALVIVYSDAAASSVDYVSVAQVRKLLGQECRLRMRVIERDRNYGCAGNIINGISDVLAEYETAIIVEDDVFPAPAFYESMCVMLEHYGNEKNVFSVSGYPTVLPEALRDWPFDVIMSPRFTCWGWGTWADRWERIGRRCLDKQIPYETPEDVPSHAGLDLQRAITKIKVRHGFYWDIPIALFCLKENMLHAISKWYLTNNIGADSGVHGSTSLPSQRANKFRLKSNPLESRCPCRFPEATPSCEVSVAIQNYLDALHDASRCNSGLLGTFDRIKQGIAQLLESLRQV